MHLSVVLYEVDDVHDNSDKDTDMLSAMESSALSGSDGRGFFCVWIYSAWIIY